MGGCGLSSNKCKKEGSTFGSPTERRKSIKIKKKGGAIVASSNMVLKASQPIKQIASTANQTDDDARSKSSIVGKQSSIAISDDKIEDIKTESYAKAILEMNN